MVRVSSYLLCSVGLTFFCLCATQPNNPSETTHPIKPVVLWKTGEDHSGPEEVDSMRFTVFSADGNFTDTIQKTFHFDDHQAKINVPAGSRLTLKVEGLDEEGFVYMLACSADDDLIRYHNRTDATHVTPRSPPALVIALSTCNFYLSWKDRLITKQVSSFNTETMMISQTWILLKAKLYLHSSVNTPIIRPTGFLHSQCRDLIQSPTLSTAPDKYYQQGTQFLQSSDQISGILYPTRKRSYLRHSTRL